LALKDEELDICATGTVEVKANEPCTFCSQDPCDWDMFGEEITQECEELQEKKLPPNEIRFHGYKLYTRLKHGVLRRYDRRPLPICVRCEILDNWPDPNHSYVGFQSAIKEASYDD
jgi:hypothetical protein